MKHTNQTQQPSLTKRYLSLQQTQAGGSYITENDAGPTFGKPFRCSLVSTACKTLLTHARTHDCCSTAVSQCTTHGLSMAAAGVYDHIPHASISETARTTSLHHLPPSVHFFHALYGRLYGIISTLFGPHYPHRYTP